MKLATFSAALAAFAALSACGDPLLTAQQRGDEILTIQGQVLADEGAGPAADYSAAVVFTRQVWEKTEAYTEFEVVHGKIEGEFPASFQIDLEPPAAVFPHSQHTPYFGWNHNLVVTPIQGEVNDEGLRHGHLVIGPRAEFDKLPSRRPGTGSDGGRLLKLLLPKSTITAYQVLYYKAKHPTRMFVLDYPGDTSGSHFIGVPTSPGYTFFDTRQMTTAITWNQCAKSRLPLARETPEFHACLAASDALTRCFADCSSRYPTDPEARFTCILACDAMYPDLLTEEECQRQAALPLIAATCGEEVRINPKEIHVLGLGDKLSIQLGNDDASMGLPVAHVTRVP